MKKLKEGDYLFSLETDKQRPIFYKVYKEPVSARFLRMSWISALMKTNPTNTNKEMKELGAGKFFPSFLAFFSHFF
jgi:hypothetical protein